MISVSVEADIATAIRDLNLLPREAERAAYRAINKVADEILSTSAKAISAETGIRLGNRAAARNGDRGERNTVYGRMYVRGASAGRLIASVHALPSAHNVGQYDGATPKPVHSSKGRTRGVNLRAWGRFETYDRAFVKGKQGAISVKRKVWRRTGPGKDNVTDKVWGPSIRKSFERPWLQARQAAIIRQRWPVHFERYLRGELVKLGKADLLKGVSNVLPGATGAVVSEE